MTSTCCDDGSCSSVVDTKTNVEKELKNVSDESTVVLTTKDDNKSMTVDAMTMTDEQSTECDEDTPEVHTLEDEIFLNERNSATSNDNMSSCDTWLGWWQSFKAPTFVRNMWPSHWRPEEKKSKEKWYKACTLAPAFL